MIPVAPISIVGMGYVGLTTSVCLASRGYNIIGFDIDVEKIKNLKLAKSAFHEKGLEPLMKRAIEKRKFIPTSDHSLLDNSSVFFVCVGTPSNPDGSANLEYVKHSCEMIAKIIKSTRGYKVVCIKSTVPPGTALNLVLPIIEKISGKKEGRDFGICSNPEFLREGNALEDTFNPDKIVIGCYSIKTTRMMKKLYSSFYGNYKPAVIVTNPTNAEMIKYANNAFLATKISFINTIARVCQSIEDCDVKIIAKAIGLDRRIGGLFLNAGLGYGGSCFPKDVRALISLSNEKGVKSDLLNIVDSVNEEQPLQAVNMAENALGGLEGKTVALLGLSFKPNTDDMREAVSIKIIRTLLEKGSRVKAHDPMAIPTAKMLFQDKIDYFYNVQDCIRDSDCVIIVTEWKDYYKLKPSTFSKLMRHPLIIDGRRVLKPEISKKLNYYAVGLGKGA